MKRIGIIFLVFFVISCAKVSVETKNPIKVDINMRVDIYQHVVDDVEDINDQIYGSSNEKLNFLFGFEEVYAADLSGAASEAISRRKKRAGSIEAYFGKGYIGENKHALLESRGDAPEEEGAKIKQMISEENKDRDAIYKAVADKNGSDVSFVRKASFESDYKRALSGYWFQILDGGGYNWKKK
ncbi:MAG: DUF1318 domain-containing protein [Candidatus Omnitrophica bacterium]|nr:DUF1318 domain-containing protein [Candidatus Omnitrophota bacterium]